MFKTITGIDINKKYTAITIIVIAIITHNIEDIKNFNISIRHPPLVISFQYRQTAILEIYI